MKLSILAAVALAATATSNAGIVAFYTNQTAWETAVGTFSVETFDALATGQLPVGSSAVGLLTFAYPGPLNSAARIEAGAGVGGTNALSGIVGIDGNERFGDLPAYNDITLPWAATAFGARWFSASSAGQLVLSIPGATINLPDHLASPGNGFFGFISDTAFTTLRITPLTTDVNNPGEVFELDNVKFNSVVPEPGAYVVLSAGLILLFAVRRRRSIAQS
jgi:hypothetical protein